MTRVFWSCLRQSMLAIWVFAAGSLAGRADVLLRPAMSRTAELADIAVVRTQYLTRDMAFTPATRAMAEVQLDALEKRAGQLSSTQFAVALAEIGGLTDNAHSGLRLFDPRAQPLARLPLHLLWLPDALIVARASGAAADLAGARVLKIEGRAPAALYAGAKVLLGGSEAGRKHWLNDWIEAAGILHALGLARSSDRVSFTVQLRNGEVVQRSVAMVPSATLSPTAEVERLWSPDPVPGEHGWTAALPLDHLPLYLRDGNRPFRVVSLPAQHALYVQFRSNEDEDGHPIAAFLDQVRAKIATTRPRYLVVDLRFDVGGNLLTTLAFMRKLPGSVRGHTYLLVGPYTFSAGIISAAAVKKSGGDRVTVVGDRVGDRAHFWSEGANIHLPNSHYVFRYTDGQFNLTEGCSGEPGCMDDKYPFIKANFASLIPDIRAPLTARAYFADRDPAMEAVAKDIARRNRRR